MTQWLKQSTAATVKIGPFVDSTDGATAETGLTISQADIRLSKNGGNIAQSNNAAGATHDELGFYDVPLDTTDTNTLGRLLVAVHEAGALPVWEKYMVVPANVWDSMFGADKLQVHADEITAGLITATAIADNAITAAKIAADAIGASELAADAVTEIQSGLATTAALATVDTVVDAILVDTDTTIPALIATVDSNVDAILVDTGTSGVVVAAASKTGYELTSAEHNSIADAILKRDWTAVTGEAARSMLNALRFLRNKWDASGGTLTVTKEDDTTAAWTGALTTDATADPIIGVDP